ncbi:ABC transporter permease [Actinomadura macrotermitis]|uniref:Macrolide export ATP-binding/permease protein MacB n=1 Tax=Actinomadura macrotermitis TaxID=2585200 RepID=A0A7K0BY18_9ACTN|nr:Macrolide export ATP-binding/permease protein MacB [Actinomadura macrotermitis]
MSPLEVLRFALRGLAADRLRSGLTVLGVLIGVAAVILLVAFGNGSSEQVKKSIQRLGADSLTVSPGGDGGGGVRAQARDLTVKDAEALAKSPSIRSASPVVSGQSAAAAYAGTSGTIDRFIGTTPDYFAAASKTVAAGTAFAAGDGNVVVIGSTVASDLFAGTDPLGKKITVGGIRFTVIGVLKASGATSGGFSDPDSVAVAPLAAVQAGITGYGALDQIVVQARGTGAVDAAQAEAGQILLQRHGTADFTVATQAGVQSAVSESSRTFTVLLGAVAAISLLVGGIGITNIMLVTVAERTREIGIRKAVGAPPGAILGQFAAEATVLSLIGGLLGVAAGVAGSLFTIAGVKPVLVPSSIALALGVSVAIGLFFGGYPAARAARLRPIEALRHE